MSDIKKFFYHQVELLKILNLVLMCKWFIELSFQTKVHANHRYFQRNNNKSFQMFEYSCAGNRLPCIKIR